MIVDLLPSEEQQMIEESVKSLLADKLPVERLREARNHGGAAERAAWNDIAGLGLFGLGLAEDEGGLGLGLAEEALVARALGLNLVSPLVLAQLAAPHLASDEAVRAALIAGEARAAFASDDGETLRLIDGEGADQVIVLSDSGASLVARASLGVAARVEGLDEALAFERLSGRPAGAAGDGSHVSLLLAAYLTGVSQAALTLAVEYAKTREQFGQPIGAFQGIKFQCADMATRSAAAEAQVFHAAVAHGHGLDDAAEIAAARLLANDAALANAKQNIQIHGGMGFTAECDAHLFLKRAHVLSILGSRKTLERRRVLGQVA